MKPVRFAHLTLLMVLAFAAGPLLAGTEELTPNSAKECSICHIRWVDEFRVEGTPDLLIDYPAQRQVAAEMMCYSCHDGSIVDSRWRVWETSRHKTGKKPSDKITVPPEYPLDNEGRIQCYTCHSAHGVEAGTDIATSIFLREPNVNSSMCKKCHQGKDRGPEKGSHPVDVEFPQFPQKILDAGGKAGTGNTVICESCHTPHGSTAEHFLVVPNEGEGSLTHSMLCETCHTVSPDITSEDKLRHFSHPVAVKLPSDAQLPEKWDNGEKPYLGKGDTVNCRTCHSPHNGIQNNHLLTTKKKGDELCLTCHSSKKIIYGTKHDIARFFPDSENADGEKAAEKGTCRSCHFMHKGYAPKMWARKADAPTLEGACTSCHSENGLGKKKLTGKYTHPVEVKPQRIKQEGNELPLFTDKGRRDPEGKISCASCHDPHRWSPTNDDRGGDTKEGDVNNSFLRKASTPDGKLCKTCHADKWAVRGSKHDMSLMEPHSRNAKGQTIEESGICGACHTPHNAKGPKLWARNMKRGKEVIERLCSSCHAKGREAEEKTTGENSHPIGVKLSPAIAKQSGLPLFAKDGKRSKRGHVSCATCHEVHRWEPGVDKGPGKRKIEGDRFNSFLRKPNDDDATLCASCHRENALVVGTDHDMRITAPREKNLNGETAKQSGVCGACHMVHNAFGSQLWARGVGPGEHRNEAQCKGCHAKRKAAARKAIGEPSHPMNEAVSDARPTLKRETSVFYEHARRDGKAELPLFKKNGERSIDGDITCSTCHNVHRWDPNRWAKGSGKKDVEGDGGNSFLRKSNLPDSGLCATCHTRKRLVVGTDHDMSVTAPEQRNSLGQTVAQSGVCSACHEPHGSTAGGYLLWARKLGTESDLPQEQVCFSCHTKNGIAKNKVVTEFSHPRNVIITELYRPGQNFYAPVYDEKGRKVEAGLLSCPTCHDPHVWSATDPRPGSGKPVEGNARNSFLRFRSKNEICRNCHGLDSLVRYKYFHTKRVRKRQPMALPE